MGAIRHPIMPRPLAYKLFRQLEVGIEGGYIRDKGQGLAPGHGTTAGSVTYELFPLEAFILLRGVFSERQWLVPYAGGGWTRMYYQEKIEFQDTIKGYTDGYHGGRASSFYWTGLTRTRRTASISNTAFTILTCFSRPSTPAP